MAAISTGHTAANVIPNFCWSSAISVAARPADALRILRKHVVINMDNKEMDFAQLLHHALTASDRPIRMN